jgi:hypothetical protein
MVGMALGRVSAWWSTATTAVRLARRHGLKGLVPALQDEIADQQLDIERACIGAPLVTFESVMAGRQNKTTPESR